MKADSAAKAVEEFTEIKKELGPLIQSIGLKALSCSIRQKHGDVEWICQEIEFDRASETFMGSFYTEREGPDGGSILKMNKVFIDVDAIDSIEFETFDSPPEGRCRLCGQSMPKDERED